MNPANVDRTTNEFKIWPATHSPDTTIPTTTVSTTDVTTTNVHMETTGGPKPGPTEPIKCCKNPVSGFSKLRTSATETVKISADLSFLQNPELVKFEPETRPEIEYCPEGYSILRDLSQVCTESIIAEITTTKAAIESTVTTTVTTTEKKPEPDLKNNCQNSCFISLS